MTTLIIYAHPGAKGHNVRILAEVQKELKKKKETYTLIDLYKKGYDPILHKQEHFTSGHRHVAAETKRYQKQIKQADNLIFIYPVWWGLMPAILKGFLDRTLTPRFAYRYQRLPFTVLGLQARPIGLLKDKRAVVFTTVGAPHWAHLLFTRDAHRFLMKRNILGFCGIKANVYTLPKCDTALCESKEKAIVRFVHRGLRRLFSRNI